jgi:hypothetical protein
MRVCTAYYLSLQFEYAALLLFSRISALLCCSYLHENSQKNVHFEDELSVKRSSGWKATIT